MKILQELTGTFFGILGFSLIFRLRKKYIWEVCIGGNVVWLIYRFLFFATGQMFISCIGASVFVELYSEILAKKYDSVQGMFIIFLMFSLIPGGNLYYTMSGVVQGNMPEAIRRGALTLKWGLGIAVGISLSGTYRKMLKNWKNIEI